MESRFGLDGLLNAANEYEREVKAARAWDERDPDASIVRAIQRELPDAIRERDELKALFDLQFTRVQQATMLWRQYHPGNDLV